MQGLERGAERICALISRENINITLTLQGIAKGHIHEGSAIIALQKRENKGGNKSA